MSRSFYTNPGSNAGSNAGGMSAIDYITMASGHSPRDTSLLHPSHASPSRASSRWLDNRTLSPNDSISVAPSRHAPSTHGGHSVAASRHSPSTASRNSHRAPSVGGSHSGSVSHAGSYAGSHAGSYAGSYAGSHAGSHVPQSTIRNLASGAGSSYEASQALARYNNNRSASGGTMVSRATSRGGNHYGQSPTAGTIATGRTITVTETERPGKRKTVVKIYEPGEVIME